MILDYSLVIDLVESYIYYEFISYIYYRVTFKDIWGFVYYNLLYSYRFYIYQKDIFILVLYVKIVHVVSFANSLEPLAHHWNVASFSLFFRYNLVDVHLKWLNWFQFLFLEGGLLIILIDCMIFLLPFLDVKRMSMSTVSIFAQLEPGIICL